MRAAATGTAEEISKAAMALAEMENDHATMDTAVRRWSRIVKAPSKTTLDQLQDFINAYIDRWLVEWGETAAKLSQRLDAYEKLVKHRQMQQEASD